MAKGMILNKFGANEMYGFIVQQVPKHLHHSDFVVWVSH